MDIDYKTEIENLKKEMDDLKALLTQFIEGSSKKTPAEKDLPLKNIRPMKNMHPDSKLSSLMNSLCKSADEGSQTGSITYLGVFSSGGRDRKSVV